MRHVLSVDEREAALLAPYAMHSARSAGRRFPEPPHPYRGPFQRDRDRIVHSAAHRRLAHKMQVFTGDLGDYHRTRLTHTLEVALIARTLGRALGLNEDLIEALALAHDIGHPPFGHAGEEVLDECLADVGGFSHNRHALRIVEQLEQRPGGAPGLNLSVEVLEAQANRALPPGARPTQLLEAQVVDAADSVAYDTHDADDALELGLIELDELLEIPLWSEAADRVRAGATALDRRELKRAVIHELIDWQVGDLLDAAARHIAERNIDSIDAVRSGEVAVRPSPAIAKKKEALETFLNQRVYRHPQVMQTRDAAQQWLREMFDCFTADPRRLPDGFRQRVEAAGVKLSVGDYLAGMTDRYAQQQHARHCRATAGPGTAMRAW